MMENGEVHAYDKFVVPVARLIESLLSPIGKNLLFVRKKKYADKQKGENAQNKSIFSFH